MNKSIYTEEEHIFMKEYVPNHTYLEIQHAFTEKFGWEITLAQIKNYTKYYNVNTGRGRTFQKGVVVSKDTVFKKGHIPHTHKPVGSESLNQYGYIKVKVAEPNEWRFKQNIIWEEHNGQIPKGNIVIFLDGDNSNFDISNLQCITRAENLYMNRNNLRFSDKEITRTATNLAKLECKIKEMTSEEV